MNYTSFTVRTKSDWAWFLLIGEDDGGYRKRRHDCHAEDTIVIKNLLSNNGLPPRRGPKSIMYTGSPYASLLAPYEKLWIATEDRSYYVNTQPLRVILYECFRTYGLLDLEIPEQLNPVHLLLPIEREIR